mgnify:FL=1
MKLSLIEYVFKRNTLYVILDEDFNDFIIEEALESEFEYDHYYVYMEHWIEEVRA